MTKRPPTESQFQELKRLLDSIEFAIPPSLYRAEDGAVHVVLENVHVIDDGRAMERLLADFHHETQTWEDAGHSNEMVVASFLACLDRAHERTDR